MTWDELKERLNWFRNREIVMFQILDAVEKFTEARIAASGCSMLRDLVIQRLKEVNAARPPIWRMFKYAEWEAEVKHLQNTLSVIDELSPVA